MKFLFCLLFPLLAQAAVEAEFSAYSNFVWRGVTFTENRPAIQGQLDAEGSQGFYFNTFISNAEFSDEARGGNARVSQEVDFTLGKRWKAQEWMLQLFYARFLFPNADAFNSDEWNMLFKYKRISFELSYMDDFFGYRTIYRYLRLGYEWVYQDSVDGALLVGYNNFSRQRGTIIGDGDVQSMNGGYKNYFDVYWVSRKTFENQLAVEVAVNWTNRREYLVNAGEVNLEKSRDFAVIVGFIYPFKL